MRIKSNTYAGNISKRGKVKPSLVIMNISLIVVNLCFMDFREKPMLLLTLLDRFFLVSLYSLSLDQVNSGVELFYQSILAVFQLFKANLF
jgi:hypothetical protein